MVSGRKYSMNGWDSKLESTEKRISDLNIYLWRNCPQFYERQGDIWAKEHGK